jgi:casein kinase 1
VHPPRHARTAAVKKDDLADILNDLAKLNMGARQILGDRTNVEDVVKHTKADAKLNSGQRSEPITISSGSESDTRVNLMPKAYQLNQLAEQVSKATDNPAISQLVRQFIGVLKINSSRTLTREAFHFLDKLYKQLDDPSVFIKAKKWVDVGHVLGDLVLTTFKGHRRRGHLVNKCRRGNQAM